MPQLTVKQYRDLLIALCDEGHGDLPVSNKFYDATSYALPPVVVCKVPASEDTFGADLYFSLYQVEQGYPESRGMATPAPTFVAIR